SGSDATRPEVRALELPQRTDPRRRAAGARRAPRSAARCGAIDRRSASRRPPEPRVLELYRSADAALFRESKDEGGRGGVFDRDADRFVERDLSVVGAAGTLLRHDLAAGDAELDSVVPADAPSELASELSGERLGFARVAGHDRDLFERTNAGDGAQMCARLHAGPDDHKGLRVLPREKVGRERRA